MIEDDAPKFPPPGTARELIQLDRHPDMGASATLVGHPLYDNWMRNVVLPRRIEAEAAAQNSLDI
jgi:hypothetical protein